ncbi:MAG: DUF1614 domain-containing protein [Synechococcales bacterium]|nr:DUF1614 domain-containing protein [Synechococcales bacterium]
MIYLPVSLLLFVLLLLVLPFLWVFLTVDVVQAAAVKLGFSPEGAVLLFLAILLGGAINIPLYRTETRVELVEDVASLWLRQFWGIPLPQIKQSTVVALNVGGGLIPTVLALYQFSRASVLAIAIVTAIVSGVSYLGSRVVPGIGIQMNPLIAPTTAALSAMLVTGFDHAAPVAFAGGVLGTLIGADILHLKEIQENTPGVLSIGGAGVFDGIALCGLFALLLT